MEEEVEFRPPPHIDRCENCGHQTYIHTYELHDPETLIYKRMLHCGNCGELLLEWYDGAYYPRIRRL